MCRRVGVLVLLYVYVSAWRAHARVVLCVCVWGGGGGEGGWWGVQVYLCVCVLGVCVGGDVSQQAQLRYTGSNSSTSCDLIRPSYLPYLFPQLLYLIPSKVYFISVFRLFVILLC